MPEYIEREALIARLNKVCVTDDVFGMGIQVGVEHAINCTKEAPTADVVEVRHGEWVPNDYFKGHYYCSECTRHIEDTSENPSINFPYCHCGAKMDGKGD